MDNENKKPGLETVEFKTENRYFWKERAGLKPNTVRRIDGRDERFISLHEGVAKKIRIVHVDNGLSFERHITDVTFFEGTVIISWADGVGALI